MLRLLLVATLCSTALILLGCQNQSANSKPTARSYTGTLSGGVMAIGAETTGWQLDRGGQTAPLEVDVSLIREQVQPFDGKRVTLYGHVVERDYLERGTVKVLVAERIAAVGS